MPIECASAAAGKSLPCECELPGFFCCGVPGALAHFDNDNGNGRLAQGAKVERCDTCQRLASDAEALQYLCDLGLA